MISSQNRNTLRCWAEIDEEALRGNARICQQIAADTPQIGDIMAIVKADGYGHGIEAVVRALSGTVHWFGVANLEEAERVLAVAKSPCQALVLSPLLPTEYTQALRLGLHIQVSTAEEIDYLEKAAASQETVAQLHLTLDTGMGRMGAQLQDVAELSQRIAGSSHCQLAGISSHFPSADEEPEFTRQQIEIFEKEVESLSPAEGCQIHISNSAGLLGYHSLMSRITLSRPGLALYGVSPLHEKQSLLRAVMTWKCRVTLVRDLPAGSTIGYGRSHTCAAATRVATLSVGYGDGYPRALSGKNTQVLVQGQRCPLLGRVSMDQIVVDISALTDSVSAGDEVVLMGSQKSETISAGELAEKAGTIPWEIFTGLTNRVARISA